MSWRENSLIFLTVNGELKKVSDHNRSPLSEDVERIENKQRMVDGTLRRYSVTKKRTWSCSWDMFPSANTPGGLVTADGGMSGMELETIANTVDTPMRMVIRRGAARGVAVPNIPNTQLPYSDNNFYIVNVMISDFSKEVVKRGPKSDLWSMSLTLEEV